MFDARNAGGPDLAANFDATVTVSGLVHSRRDCIALNHMTAH